MKMLSVFICCIFLGSVQNFKILPLNELKWKLNNTNKGIKNEVRIPGGIITDLQNIGVLKESFYYRFNDVEYRWVAKENWTYSVEFPVNIEILDQSSKELIFYGLDGHATIVFNDHVLGKAINSFIRYRFDVTQFLVSKNRLKVEFESPIKSAADLAKNAVHSIPPSCVPHDYNGECHVNFLRRMQASFAWDWGLAAPSVGIWKPAELVTYYEDLIVRDVTVSTILESGKWKVVVKVYCDGPLYSSKDINGRISLVLFVKNNEIIKSAIDVSLPSNSKSRSIAVSDTIFVPTDLVELWWPSGYGLPVLYRLLATFTNGNNDENTKTVMIGFRTVKLVQEAVNKKNQSHGLSFYFSVNNVPIFAKGSNYIPINILPENSFDKSKIENLIESVKISNMNILRIWGGGLYESDYFYELCDRHGILIWQDMMFACSMYPADTEFLFSVKEEVSQQIRRLQHHPSIVLWAGNNENEAALSGNWYNTRSNFSLFKREYVQLYVDTIRTTVLSVDSTRSFIVSSPSNGLQSDAEGYVSNDPYNPLYGDVHFYDYFHDGWLTDHFPVTRFASEYGYQSLPSLTSLQKVATDDDLSSLTSPFMKHRQHLPFGYIYLIIQMIPHFAAPLLDDLKNIIYVSQISQAWSVKSQTEWYRKWRNKFLPNGTGGTMGAMYWQLNDVWQAPSWSSIEFDGKWKMLQYYAKEFFAPVIITADLDKYGKITVNVISDLLNDVSEVNVRMDIYKWDSMIPVDTISKTITLEKESAQVVMVTSITDIIESKPKCRSEEFTFGEKCFLKLTLQKSEANIKHENYLYPMSFKKVQGLKECNIQVVVESCSNFRRCEIKVQANAICLFVWLDTGDISGFFSENGFTMTDITKEILFHSREDVTPSQLQKYLTATVLDKQRLEGFSYVVDLPIGQKIISQISSGLLNLK